MCLWGTSDRAGDIWGLRVRFNNFNKNFPSELKLALLRMRAGDLFHKSRGERRSLIASLIEPRKVEKALEASYRPVGVLGKLDSELLAGFQNGVEQDGRETGKRLIARGFPDVVWLPHHHHPDAPKGMFSRETEEEMDSQVREYVVERIGAYNSPSAAAWHLVAALIFMVWAGSLASEDASEYPAPQDFLQLAWALTMLFAVFLTFRKYLSSTALASRAGYTRQFAFVAKPFREGLESALTEAMNNRAGEAPDWTQSRKDRSTRGSPRGRQAQGYRGAEEMCAEWLRELGYNASTTMEGADGGVDIRSFRYLGQVKNYRGSVPVQAVREIHGIAASEDKEGIFFTSGRYTKAAIDFADKVAMPLITYDAVLREFDGANWHGKLLTS